MRISDWSSDVCSSDLASHAGPKHAHDADRMVVPLNEFGHGLADRGRAFADLRFGDVALDVERISHRRSSLAITRQQAIAEAQEQQAHQQKPQAERKNVV